MPEIWEGGKSREKDLKEWAIIILQDGILLVLKINRYLGVSNEQNEYIYKFTEEDLCPTLP